MCDNFLFYVTLEKTTNNIKPGKYFYGPIKIKIKRLTSESYGAMLCTWLACTSTQNHITIYTTSFCVKKERLNMSKLTNIPSVKCGIISVSRDCFIISLSENRRKAIVEAYGQKYNDADKALIDSSYVHGVL